ncbi:MAG: four helix bundle protein [Bacteroidales bacterium]
MSVTNDQKEAFKLRLKQFALRTIKLFQALPKTGEAQIIGKQMLRSATSVAANYRAACRARSGNEFFSKLSIVVEEADETLFWLELLSEAEIIHSERLQPLINEATEILKITSSSRKSAKQQ